MEVNNRTEKRVLVRQKEKDQWRRRKFKRENESSVRCQAMSALLLESYGLTKRI
jgi:hypothetical protein